MFVPTLFVAVLFAACGNAFQLSTLTRPRVSSMKMAVLDDGSWAGQSAPVSFFLLLLCTFSIPDSIKQTISLAFHQRAVVSDCRNLVMLISNGEILNVSPSCLSFTTVWVL